MTNNKINRDRLNYICLTDKKNTQRLFSKNSVLKYLLIFSITILLTSIFVITPIVKADPWFDTSWSNRKEIIINHNMVDESLTNFPVLISLASDPGLADKVQDDGDDAHL